MEIAVISLILATILASKAAAQNNGCFSCCTTLASIVQTDPRCLCMVLDGSAESFGIAINHTRALELPGICKVQAPPISQCTAIPVPPATAPEDPPEETSNQVADAPKGSPNSNATSSSRVSKNAANLMVTMLIPACALIYIF